MHIGHLCVLCEILHVWGSKVQCVITLLGGIFRLFGVLDKRDTTTGTGFRSWQVDKRTSKDKHQYPPWLPNSEAILALFGLTGPMISGWFFSSSAQIVCAMRMCAVVLG